MREEAMEMMGAGPINREATREGKAMVAIIFMGELMLPKFWDINRMVLLRKAIPILHPF